MSGRGRGLRPRKVKLPSCSTADELCSPNITDSVVTGCICCRCKQLVSKLQRFKCIDDACSLMGMVTAFGQQLKEKPNFFMQTMQEIYRIMEDAQEYLLRYVLLHLIELVASNGELPASTLEYYNDKVILPKSCEDAFHAAMKFGEGDSCGLQIACSDCQRAPVAVETRSPEVRSPEVRTLEARSPEVCLPKVMNEPAIMAASTLFDSDRSSAAFKQKEPNNNNNNVEDENLADVFGKCMESALSNCLGGSQPTSQPSEELVKAEKEEGLQDAGQCKILPSTTTFELQSSFRGTECGGRLITGVKVPREDAAVPEDENKRLKQEEKTKKYEWFMKVRGDVIVRLSSDLEDHLKDVFDVLSLHFKSPLASPENAATVPNHCGQKAKGYSREFLIECSSSAFSRKLPWNWSELSQMYPEICLKEGWIFTVHSNSTSPPHCVVVKSSGSNFRRSNSSPYPGGNRANGTKPTELLAVTDNGV